MKISAFKSGLFWILLPLLFIFSWGHAFPEQDSVVKTYKNATAPFDDEKRVDSVLLIPNVARAAEIAHGNITLDHGGQDKPLSCYTCHKKDDRNFLVTEEGSKIDMDHSYQMCGHCHFRQKKDWMGGAHGKRVSYWAGTRVVKTCTSCHDPHSPHFEKRWPKTYSPPLVK